MDDDDARPARNRTGIGLALGLPLGAAVGLIVFDSVALGAGLGMIFGLCIGAALDMRSGGDER